MKKALIILLVLAVAGGLFAQMADGFRITGDVRTGMGLLITDMEETDPILGNFSNRDNIGARADFWFRYTNPEGVAGFNVRARGDSRRDQNDMLNRGNHAEAGFYINVYEVWFRGFDNMAELRAGRIDWWRHNTPGGVDWNLDIGAGSGVSVDVRPMNDLNIGFGLFADQLYADQPKLEVVRFNAGVTYTAPELVTVAATFRNVNIDDTAAMIGFRILALREMGFTNLSVDSIFENLQRRHSAGGVISKGEGNISFSIGQQIEYVTGDFTAGLRARQDFRIFGDAASDAVKDAYVPNLRFYVFGQSRIQAASATKTSYGVW